MDDAQIIDQDLLDKVSALARQSPRRRKNYNFHPSDEDASHRLLNAMEPDSYIAPHCHLNPAMDETIVVLRGRFGVVLFGADGAVNGKALLQPEGKALGVNIPHGVFHTLVALVPNGVFFESKAGPYRPLVAEEKAPWAPAPETGEAERYVARLQRLFG